MRSQSCFEINLGLWIDFYYAGKLELYHFLPVLPVVYLFLPLLFSDESQKKNCFRSVLSRAQPSSNHRGGTLYSISVLDIPRRIVHIFLSREELLMCFNFYCNLWCSSNHRKDRDQSERWSLPSVARHSLTTKLTVIDCDQGFQSSLQRIMSPSCPWLWSSLPT